MASVKEGIRHVRVSPLGKLIFEMADGRVIDAGRVTGKNGADGLNGLDGEAIKGDKGDRGDQGLAGADGAVGPAGADGKAGPTGPAGGEGPRGEIGPVGPMGPAGLDGATGAHGLQGATGKLGPMPRHQIEGHKLRFQQTLERWGDWIDLGKGGPSFGAGGLPQNLNIGGASQQQFFIQQSFPDLQAGVALLFQTGQYPGQPDLLQPWVFM